MSRARRRDDDYDDDRSAPGAVVAAVAVGTIPTPFLAIYAVLFLVHGSVHPVVPPDITRSKGGEFVAGLIASALFAVAVLALVQAIGGRRRWPFAAVQLATLGAAVYFLIDGTEGGTLVSVVLVVTAVLGLVLIFLPPAWPFYDRVAPPWLAALVGARRAPRTALPAGSAPVGDAVPSSPRSVARPRPGGGSDRAS